MATAYLLQELAATDHALAITVVGDEPSALYNRVLLSSVLAGSKSEDQLAMFDALPSGVQMLTGRRVVSIDGVGRVATTCAGERIAFDQLVFATGASAARPALAGINSDGVTALRTLADCRALRERGAVARRAVVVGGGLLGLEAAHGLNRLGCHTTVVHRRGHLMNRQLDCAGGQRLRGALEATGLHFAMDAGLRDIAHEGGRVRGVTLTDGRHLSSDLLVFATGISPNAALAKAAGLDVDRGIRVDDQMRSSLPGVWALGECCQLGEHCFGLVAPVREQARVLARALAGSAGPGFEPGHYPTQLKVSGVDIYSDGDLEGAGEDLVLDDAAAGVYRRLRLRDGCLVGAVLVGDKHGGNWYSELIRERADVNALRPGLMFGPEICESLNVAAAAAA